MLGVVLMELRLLILRCLDAVADVELGLLLSPNYPNKYQNNLECTHQLSTELGKMITIEFELLLSVNILKE